MKKSLIALAVASAFTASAAYADVSISGAINMGIAYKKSDDPTATTVSNSIVAGPGGSGTSQLTLTQNYSNISINSLEDLGGGLKVDFSWQLVAQTITAGGGGAVVQNRNSHLGLVGESWGGVWIGTNENIYERYLYSIDPLDGAAGVGGNLAMLGTPGYGQVFDAGQGQCGFTPAAGCADFYRRTDQTIWYDSPNWGGFSFGVAYTLDAFKTNNGPNPQVFSAGAKYQHSMFSVWGAIEQHTDMYGLGSFRAANGTSTGSTDTATQVGGSVTFGDFTVFGIYEMLKYEADGPAVVVNEYKRNALAVGVKWNLSTGYVGAQYIMAQEGDCTLTSGAACNSDKSGGSMLGVGYFHNLSKQTQLQAMLGFIDNDELQNYSMPGSGNANGSGVGSKNTAFTVGMKHTF